jgi:hypothetical protein
MKTNKRFCDYTNRFFENSNTCVGVREDQVIVSYKKGIRDSKIFGKIHMSRDTTVATLMEVVKKLINIEKAFLN